MSFVLTTNTNRGIGARKLKIQKNGVDIATFSANELEVDDDLPVTANIIVPTNLSDLSDDATHRFVSDTEKAAWNAKSNFSGSYNDLTDKPTYNLESKVLVNDPHQYVRLALSDGSYSGDLKILARKDATAVASSTTNGNIKINDTETTVYTHPGSGTNPHGTTKSDIGLGNVGNFKAVSTVASQGLSSTEQANARANIGAIASSLKGAASGVAELDSNGKVPSAQLPSYVDDVLEYDSLSNFPTTGETGKIYVAKDTNKTYRWSGTAYVEISPSLALGETSSTAYRGDRGKTAYDHSQTTSGNPHNVTKSDVGLGNVGNFKAVSTVASQGLTDTEKSNARANIGAGTSSLTIGLTASTAAAGNHTHSTSIAADSGTNQLTLAANTKYKLTAGGTGFVFTTPPDTNTWRGIQDNLTSDSTTESLSAKQGKALANGSARDSTKLPLSGGTITGGLEIKGRIAGDTGSTGHGFYGGGGYHNAYNNIILHGDSSTGSSGIVFASDKITDSSGTVTNINQPSDRAFIQYHAYGVTTPTSEGTNPTLATSGESGRFVIGIGNDGGSDKLWLQTSGRLDLIHQVGATSYVIPDTNNTTGSVGSATQPTYVDGGAIKACTYTIAKSVPSDAVFTDTTYSSKAAASGGTDVSLVTTGEKYTWNNKSNLTIGTTATTAAAGNHTHTASIATDSGTNQLTMAANTKYKLTAGGSTYIFTTPPDTNTWRGIQDNLTSDSTTESLSAKQGKNLANGSARDSTKLPLAGGTMTGQILTSFKNSVAMGSYQATSTTIADLCNELRFSSGCCGSFSLGTAYTKDNITISTGWYNFLWIPHRSGGVNGAASGDNCNYGSFIISGMTVSGCYLIRYTNSGITELRNLYADTNTTYAAGTGVTISGTNNAINVSYGTAANTACQGNDSRLSNARTPTSHTHGNIQNGGTLQTNDVAIASGDKLVITDSSDSSKVARASIAFDGSTATKCLTQKGTWEAFTNNAGTITGSGTSGYIAKWNGGSSITNGPQFGSSTTTFLRNDGTWASPGATYFDSTKTLSTSDSTTFTFSNAAITANSAIEVYCTIYGFNPLSVEATAGTCTVVFPPYDNAVDMTCRIYVK